MNGYCYGGALLVGPNIVGINSEIYRFLCPPQVLFNMVPRNNGIALSRSEVPLIGTVLPDES